MTTQLSASRMLTTEAITVAVLSVSMSNGRVPISTSPRNATAITVASIVIRPSFAQ